MEATEKCLKEGCVYAVDWKLHPNTNGGSWYRCTEDEADRYGCMRMVAMINQKKLLPCAREAERERQLVMEL